MKKVDIIKAWKDEAYRNTLSADQISQLPVNPAGILSEEAQNFVSGGDFHSGKRRGAGSEWADECDVN